MPRPDTKTRDGRTRNFHGKYRNKCPPAPKFRTPSQQFTYGVVREGFIAENFPRNSANFPQNFRRISALFPDAIKRILTFRKIFANFPQNPFANDPISEQVTKKIPPKNPRKYQKNTSKIPKMPVFWVFLGVLNFEAFLGVCSWPWCSQS